MQRDPDDKEAKTPKIETFLSLILVFAPILGIVGAMMLAIPLMSEAKIPVGAIVIFVACTLFGGAYLLNWLRKEFGRN